MSTFDELPEDIREWLREHRPGARIKVPKEFSAAERNARDERIRGIYDAGIEAGGDSARLIEGLSREFELHRSVVYRIVRVDCRKSGTDTKRLEG